MGNLVSLLLIRLPVAKVTGMAVKYGPFHTGGKYLQLDFGRRRMVTEVMKLAGALVCCREGFGHELVNPVEILIAPHKKCIVMVGSKDFVELLGLVCGIKELSAQTNGNNGIMLTMNDERRNVETPDLLN